MTRHSFLCFILITFNGTPLTAMYRSCIYVCGIFFFFFFANLAVISTLYLNVAVLFALHVCLCEPTTDSGIKRSGLHSRALPLWKCSNHIDLHNFAHQLIVVFIHVQMYLGQSVWKSFSVCLYLFCWFQSVPIQVWWNVLKWPCCYRPKYICQAFSNGDPWATSGLQTILVWPFVNPNIHRNT